MLSIAQRACRRKSGPREGPALGTAPKALRHLSGAQSASLLPAVRHDSEGSTMSSTLVGHLILGTESATMIAPRWHLYPNSVRESSICIFVRELHYVLDQRGKHLVSLYSVLVPSSMPGYSGPFCQDKKSTALKIQNPPFVLTRNLEGQVCFMPL